MKPQPSLFAAAVLLMALGVAALFLPQELGALVSKAGELTSPVVMKLLGGSFFALGMLDWMTRFTAIGGIYGRPVVVANLTFFFIATTTLVRAAIGSDGGGAAWIGAAVSAFFAVWFARLMFGPPPGAPS